MNNVILNIGKISYGVCLCMYGYCVIMIVFYNIKGLFSLGGCNIECFLYNYCKVLCFKIERELEKGEMGVIFFGDFLKCII